MGGQRIAVEDTAFVECAGQLILMNNVQQENDTAYDSFQISDQETISMLYRLLDEDGIPVGCMFAINVVSVVKATKPTS